MLSLAAFVGCNGLHCRAMIYPVSSVLARCEHRGRVESHRVFDRGWASLDDYPLSDGTIRLLVKMSPSPACCSPPTGKEDLMNGSRGYSVHVEGVKYGVSFGSALAIAISYTANHSILWAIIHGIFSWLYVVYFALFYT